MSAKRVLITGGGGYLGARTAAEVLAASDRDVVLWLHARSIEDARAKAQGAARALARFEGRVSFAHGELEDAEPFGSVDPRDVCAVVHAAAVTRFNVDSATADRVNVEGAEKAFRFAERCPRLEELTYVSTVYAAGLRGGAVAEEAMDGSFGFANQYERSKNEAERLLAERFEHLPWRVARVATVIADDERGGVTQYNAVHNTLKLFYYGLVSLVPGLEGTPVYLVTGDFVARALAELATGGERHAIYHLAHTREESITLDELVTIAFEAFNESESFRSRRVLKPLYVDAVSFDALVGGIDGFGGDALRQALRSVAPFARQLFAPKDVKNDRLRAAVRDYRAPDPRALARATCAHLVRTKWGKA
jgi:thioester reductase-like protein